MPAPSSSSILLTLFVLLLAGPATRPAAGADLLGPSYRLRGGHFNAGGSGSLESEGSDSFSRFGASLGQHPIGPVGSVPTLRTSSNGFWPIVVGDAPKLDVDGDGLQSFLDDDDDGDGLDDSVETGTGVFVSPSDTGTSRVEADSDGDGRSDGLEVQQGTDPNVPDSPPPVPALRGAASIALALLLAGVGLAAHRRRGAQPSGGDS